MLDVKLQCSNRATCGLPGNAKAMNWTQAVSAEPVCANTSCLIILRYHLEILLFQENLILMDGKRFRQQTTFPQTKLMCK